MKKIILGVGLLGLLLISSTAFAQLYQLNPTTATPTGFDLPQWAGVLITILRWFYTIVLVLAVIMGLYAAFLYMTAAGDAAKVKKANNVLIYAIIAVVVAVLAFSITKIVGSLVPGGNVLQNP